MMLMIVDDADRCSSDMMILRARCMMIYDANRSIRILEFCSETRNRNHCSRSAHTLKTDQQKGRDDVWGTTTHDVEYRLPVVDTRGTNELE